MTTNWRGRSAEAWATGRRGRVAAMILAGFAARLLTLSAALVLGAGPARALLGLALGDPLVLMGPGR